jgi:hypothetical protein
MISLSHKDVREKRHEFEASWICDATKGLHKIIPFQSRQEIERNAEDEIEREMMGE